MNSQTERVIPAVAVPEGGGVTVQRAIGTPALRNLDPFLMLDFFGSDNPDEYIAGFPTHPHRGFSTFAYMVDGHFEHQDSMGNRGTLGPGDAQLMKAASGVVHSEMPKQEDGVLRGFQLWINLPAAYKMDPPAYQEYRAEQFPLVEAAGYSIKVLVGSYGSHTAPIGDEITEMHYYDVVIKPGACFSYTLPQHHNRFLYLFEGKGETAQNRVAENSLVVLGAEVDFVAGERGARFILCSGKPIGEPVVQYGPFVMNTQAESKQAIADFQLE